MRGIFEVVVVGKGVHGPFKDENGGPDRSYPWVSLNGTDGEGDPLKCTLAPGLDWNPELYKPAKVELELRNGGKIRCHGPVNAQTVRAAA